jgi:sulfur relay (sulfurtransferase) DsrF/TusC family protein
MGEVKIAFLVQRPQYKGETSRLAMTHAMSYQTVEILLEDGDTVTPTLCFFGEGVLGLTKGQEAMQAYGITSTESHLMNLCLVDMKVLVCKEDMEKYGISADTLPDAEDMGADVKIQVVPFSDIKTAIDDAKHLMLF